MAKKRVVIIGASGYSGAELASLLLTHPDVEIAGVFGSARRAGDDAQSFAEVWPRFRERLNLPIRAADPGAIAALRPDAVFLATPHEASLELVPKLSRSVLILDLSGAFRLKDPQAYPRHYGFEHHAPADLARAEYGMPELFRNELRGARLIAVPGCYPTASILALAPLQRAGLIAAGSRPIIDATSGVSGAGRTPALKSLFSEVSLQPYNVFKHRHQPEIDAYVGEPTLFTPHLGAFDRGILATIHITIPSEATTQGVALAFHSAYDAEPFVRLCPPGVWPAVGDVVRTNFCDLGWQLDEAHAHLIVVAAIDNLVKGAAGQAVQCMNLALGLSETRGLIAKHSPGDENA